MTVADDDLHTFEGWMRYQGVEIAATGPEELDEWRRAFDEVRQRTAATPKVGLMKLKSIPGEHRYAVAIQEGGNLWLTLWIRRSPRGEFFILLPRGEKEWNAHTSYHLDGRLHMKSRGKTMLPPKKCQPLTGVFRGSEDLGFYAGHGTKSIGAVCDPAAFSGVVKVPPCVLGPSHGGVKVDLLEPGHKLPVDFPWGKIVTQQVFCDTVPWVVITVGHCT